MDRTIHIGDAGFAVPTSSDPPLSQYLSAAKAAELLGVRRATLYSYVSRGLLAAHGATRGRGHFYRTEDVLRLKARSDARAGTVSVAAGALQWGQPVIDSAITGIGPAGPIYRGRLACELAKEGAAFEAVAAHLWGASPSLSPWRSFRWTEPLGRRSPLARMMEVTAEIAGRALDGEPLERRAPEAWPNDGELGIAEGLIALMARVAFRKVRAEPTIARSLLASLAASPGSSLGSSPLQARGERTVNESLAGEQKIKTKEREASISIEHERLVNAALVLVSDHELNASSFACRVAASADAPLAACVLSGLGAFVGARHGMASLSAYAFLRGLRSPLEVKRVLERAVVTQALPSCFGHTLYPDGDPRGATLLELVFGLSSARPRELRLLRSVVLSARELGLHPNVDLGLAGLSWVIGAPAELGPTIFAIGRTAGWVAHAREQKRGGTLLRPRARYTGGLDTPPK